MAYSLTFNPDAVDDLAKFDKGMVRQILSKTVEVASKGRDYPHRALGGDLTGYFKLSVVGGTYRVIYEVDDEAEGIVIHYIERRDKVYK